MGQQYIRALSTAGAVPWIIPLLDDDESTLRAIYEQLHGVFFAGGVDVEPSAYSEPRTEVCGLSDPARDAVETTLFRWANADEKPVLGVCRGVQMINVASGGSLHQDIAHDRPAASKHDYFPQQGYHDRGMIAHQIFVEPGTKLHELVGSSVSVNSMHHQAIKRLGSGLRPSATAPDGVIEGVEGVNGQFLLGVQWHPEELVNADEGMRRLFQAFVDAASAFRISRQRIESPLPA